MEMKPFRVRLKFHDFVLTDYLMSERLNRSWVLVQPEHRTISDLSSYLLRAFNLSGSCPHGIFLSFLSELWISSYSCPGLSELWISSYSSVGSDLRRSAAPLFTTLHRPSAPLFTALRIQFWRLISRNLEKEESKHSNKSELEIWTTVAAVKKIKLVL